MKITENNLILNLCLEIMDSNDTGDRKNEVEIMSDVLGECFVQYSDLNGIISVNVNVNQLTVSSDEESVLVSNLLPIMMEYKFPEDYPSKNSPYVYLTCQWLSRYQLNNLRDKLMSLWEPKFPVLFVWYTYLRDNTVEFLEVDKSIELSPLKVGKVITITSNCFGKIKFRNQIFKFQRHRIIDPSIPLKIGDMVEFQTEFEDEDQTQIAIHVKKTSGIFDTQKSNSLIKEIVKHSKLMDLKIMHKKMIHCQICFEDKPGTQCMKFQDCHHIYCKQCMASYFEIKISEGFPVLRCPKSSCLTIALSEQVKILVSSEMFQKYELKLMEIRSDVMNCPLPHCRTLTSVDEKLSLGQCVNCQHAFCTVCKMTYHGIEPCKINKYQKLIVEYSKAKTQDKRVMEKKYGKKFLSEMLNMSLSSEYMNKNTKSCPNCQTIIEKIDGCNKMTCPKCETHFCYLCGSKLNQQDPYRHFRNIGSSCHRNLFEGIEDNWEIFEQDENDIWIF